MTNSDGESAYEPEGVHGLIDPEQYDSSFTAALIADSYASMLSDSWISLKYAPDPDDNEWASFVTENLPRY